MYFDLKIQLRAKFGVEFDLGLSIKQAFMRFLLEI